MQVDGFAAPPGPWDAGDLLNLIVFVRHMVRNIVLLFVPCITVPLQKYAHPLSLAQGCFDSIVRPLRMPE